MLFLYQLLPLPESTTEWRIAEVVDTNRSSSKAFKDMMKWVGKAIDAQENLGHTMTDEIIRRMTDNSPQERVGIREVVQALGCTLYQRSEASSERVAKYL